MIDSITTKVKETNSELNYQHSRNYSELLILLLIL